MGKEVTYIVECKKCNKKIPVPRSKRNEDNYCKKCKDEIRSSELE